LMSLNRTPTAECSALSLHDALPIFTVRVARLERELGIPVIACEAHNGRGLVELRVAMSRTDLPLSRHAWDVPAAVAPAVAELQADRKSTRLNSSHVKISYAVFCLKK